MRTAGLFMVIRTVAAVWSAFIVLTSRPPALDPTNWKRASRESSASSTKRPNWRAPWFKDKVLNNDQLWMLQMVEAAAAP
jgi:hypothetical protein